MNDFPRDHDPACCYGGDDNTTTNINIFGKQTRHIIRTRNNVGGEIRTNLRNDPCEADEKGSRSPRRAGPLSGESEGVPDIFSIHNFGAGCGDDAEETETELDEREEKYLPVYSVLALQVASEVGDVCRHGCPATGNGG